MISLPPCRKTTRELSGSGEKSLPVIVTWPFAASTLACVTTGGLLADGGGVGTFTEIRVVSCPTSIGMMSVTGFFAYSDHRLRTAAWYRIGKVTVARYTARPARLVLPSSSSIGLNKLSRSIVICRTGWFARAIKMLPRLESPGHGGEVVRA